MAALLGLSACRGGGGKQAGRQPEADTAQVDVRAEYAQNFSVTRHGPGVRLLTIHNVHRLLEFMRELRAAVADGTFAAFREQLHQDQQQKETP